MQAVDPQIVIRSTLARTRLFADWPPSLLDNIASSSTYRVYDNGEFVIRQGRTSHNMIVVADGAVSCQRTMKGGKLVVFDILLPGQSTSHIAVLDGEPPAFDIVSKGTAGIIAIPGKLLMDAVRHDADRLFSIVQFLCRRTRLDYESLHMHIGSTLRCQIAKLLLYWARGPQLPNEKGYRVPVSISQDDLAARLGRSRQTINREINALVREGILALSYRQIQVIDVAGLNAVVEREDPPSAEQQEALFARSKDMFDATD